MSQKLLVIQQFVVGNTEKYFQYRLEFGEEIENKTTYDMVVNTTIHI